MDRIFLQVGAHTSLERGGCVMEFAAWVAGEPHSDHPACVSLVIGEFCRQWNDALDDTTRQRLIPFAIRAIGTNTGPADEETRAWMCVDWLVRVYAPAWLRLAKLDDHARALEGLARIADASTAGLAQPSLDAAWDAAARAAGDVAWDAGDVAWAAWDVAWDAAWDAAGDAAGYAAGDAAGAAGDAARAAGAAGAALRPTVIALQESAFILLGEMCDVGRVPEPEMVAERRAIVEAAV